MEPTGRGPRSRFGAGDTPRIERARSIAIEREPDLLRGAVRSRLDPHHEFARQEAVTSVVEQDGVDAMPVGEGHARGDENFIPSVRADVVHATPTLPKRFA